MDQTTSNPDIPMATLPTGLSAESCATTTKSRPMKWLGLHLETICQVSILAVGARAAFIGRNAAIGADGLSYLDVASAYLRHDWHTAINGYWSPLYSWLVAVALYVVRPSAQFEPSLVRGVNWLIYAAALYAFQDCWHAMAIWSGRTRREAGIADASPAGWLLFGYVMFLTSFPWHIEMITPDILVAAVVFGVSAVFFRMNDGSLHGASADILLGVLLAVGYYAKAILLYFALFVLVALTVRRGMKRKSVAFIPVVVFALLVFPYAFGLSRALGHPTLGDSGRLNYAWFVDGASTKTWMSPHGAPDPFFPGPRIVPGVLGFRLPVMEGVAYAPWYDAARFADTRPQFSIRGEIRQIGVNLREIQSGVLITGASLLVSTLLLLSLSLTSSLKRLRDAWMFWLPSLGVLSMYLLVHLVGRFILGFLPLVWGIVLISAVILPENYKVARRAIFAGILVFALGTFPGLAHSLLSQHDSSVTTDVAIAGGLPQYGIRPNDLVASIGTGQGAYWARLARVSVVAETWEDGSDAFFLWPLSLQESITRSMAAAGAKAVIWREDSNRPCPLTWKALPQSSGCILKLR